MSIKIIKDIVKYTAKLNKKMILYIRLFNINFHLIMIFPRVKCCLINIIISTNNAIKNEISAIPSNNKIKSANIKVPVSVCE